jgi:nucleoside-diphosphate-sugar epimerase|tara:strand:+ start:768 stop:974 length:207 start_codon:yes stop_codon:yes gene_type:complete
LRQVTWSIKAGGVEVKASYAPEADTGQNSFSLDISRFKKHFGWKPKTISRTDIKNTLRWFQGNKTHSF